MTAAKAYLAGLIALLAALGTAVAEPDASITAAEGIGAAGSALAAFAAVYFLPNARSENPTTSTPGPGDAGLTLLEALVVGLVVSVVLLVLYVAGARV